MFNELIYNTEYNLTNVLIAKDWHIWMIYFTRAFRAHRTLQTPKNLVQCDRKLLAKLRQSNRDELEAKLVRVHPQLLTKEELSTLMARRDRIVKFFDNEVKQKGEAAVLFDLLRSGQACGVVL
jgi:GTP cyclohydrolase II